MNNCNKSSIISQLAGSSITYPSLYLANLLIFPIIAFILIIYFFTRLKKLTPKHSAITRIHAIRSLQLTVCSGVLLLIIPAVILLLAKDINISLMAMIIYFISLHTGFVLIGMLNLARAMSNKLPIF